MQDTTKQKAFLLDMTRCIGCRGCQTACKQWNNLKAEKTTFFGGPGYQNPSDLSGSTYTLIKYHEVIENNALTNWAFMKIQCQHCLDPACVSVCPEGALEKKENGPVTWHPSKCIGCKSCSMACPFGIPKYEGEGDNGRIRKCDLCFSRIEEGLEPACAKGCPVDAAIFGDRDDLILVAKKRLSDNPSKYHQHIYGLNEVGGTCVLSISGIPLEDMGYPKDLATISMASHTVPSLISITSPVIGLGAFLGAMAFIADRKNQIARENRDAESKET